MNTRNSIAWFRDVIQAGYLAGRLKRLADLKDEAELNSFLTNEERWRLKQAAAKLTTEIAAERSWQPSQAIVDELTRLEREACAYGTTSLAANMAQIKDLAASSVKGEYKPSDDEALRQRSTESSAKLAELAEKHRIPVDGLDSLARWGLLVNGKYIGGIGSLK
jgi:hypothetical protein